MAEIETEVLSDRIERIDDRLEHIEEVQRQHGERLSRLEGLVEGIKLAIEQMDRRLTNLEQTMRQMMESQSSAQRWIIGIILGTWMTTILTILLKAD